MKNLFQAGDVKVFEKTVTEADFARFEAGLVHRVCSTFALAQAVEYASRLFVLEMKEEEEEGIGTMLLINHRGPAFLHEIIRIEAMVKSFERNELICTYQAKVGDRLVAEGETGQKILHRTKLNSILNQASSGNGQSER